MNAEQSSGSVSPSTHTFPFQGDFGSFGDLFSYSQSPQSASAQHDSSHAAGNHTRSPGHNFADLLAEFTLPGTAMSPPADNLVEAANETATTVPEGHEGSYSNAPSPQRHQQQSTSADGDVENDLNLKFQQFIAASLASATGGAPTPTPQQYTPQPLYATQNHSLQSSPSGSQCQSLPGSHAPSPMPAYAGATQSIPGYQPQQSLHQPAFVLVPNPYSVGPQQYAIPTQQAAVFAQQFAMLQSQGQQQMANVLAQAQAIVQANQLAAQQRSVGSQSTSADGEWRDNEFVFSPLMSPAMTPGSAFTPASSLPPSSGPLPLSTQTDFFPPLTSPALGPQMYATDHQQSLSHRNSLQGLVDGVGNLSTQLPPGSPHVFPYQSPRMHPHDVGIHTAAGSGRRGASASNKKARPSPLIKASDPALDPNRRKRRTTTSNDSKSATTSPYISASNPGSRNGSATGTFSASSSTGVPSQKTSPAECVTGIDTPSPVDLAAGPFSINGGTGIGIGLDGLPIPPPSFTSSNAQPYQLEPMGPPPPPSHSQASQTLSTSASSASSSFNPITPATIMNFASDFDIATLSSLSPGLNPLTDDHGSAYSSIQNSPMLLPELDNATRIPPLDSSGPPTTSAAGKVKTARKTTVRASPALRAIDSKGKGKASEARKSSAKQAKVAPSPRISPDNDTRTLDLGSDSRSSAKMDADPLNGGTLENRKSTHKLAEQKRRDSLKLCFDELRKLLPPILPSTDEADRRPGEGNVGGQRNGEVDPENPNKGVSKVALLRRSNEYLEILRERIERRDRAISALRQQNVELKQRQRELGNTPDERDEEGDDDEDEDEIPGLDLDLDNIDGGERRAGNLAFYEDLDFETKFALPSAARRTSAPSSRRASVSSAPASASKPTTRRSARNSAAHHSEAMQVEN
ncbi:uncharacterized protein JCM15063_003969 [Sporobolomyces koalae]|uniref:uncharacterized protein n=1 Tax=Sporobolomyces koalae TaxID=500713 RepID=UPI00316C8AA1